MWRLWAFLFGWKYALVEYGYTFYIRRIQKFSNGKEYYRVWGGIKLVENSNSQYPRIYRLN